MTTPNELRELADWFDNPNESPAVAIEISGRHTPGYLLRRIAGALEVAETQ